MARGRSRLDVTPRGFLGEPVLLLRRLGQHDDRPEQGDRGGFVAGEDQGGDLIAKLGRGEAGAGFRIARGAQQVEQVARRFRRRLGQARAPGSFRSSFIQRRWKRRAAEVARAWGSTAAAACPADGAANSVRPNSVSRPRIGGAVAIHLQREHRAAGDIQRQVLHAWRAGRSARSACAVSRASARSVLATIWRASIGITRGPSAGAMVRRCSFQASPSLSRSPSPVIGRRMRIEAGERRKLPGLPTRTWWIASGAFSMMLSAGQGTVVDVLSC